MADAGENVIPKSNLNKRKAWNVRDRGRILWRQKFESTRSKYNKYIHWFTKLFLLLVEL